MLTAADARNAIATAIDAGEAHHTDYDLDAIVAGVYAATGGYDIEAMGHDEFWQLVADNEITPADGNDELLPCAECGQRTPMNAPCPCSIPAPRY